MNLRSGYEDQACWQLHPPELLAQWHVWTTALELPCFATTVGGIGAVRGGVLLDCLRRWRQNPTTFALNSPRKARSSNSPSGYARGEGSWGESGMSVSELSAILNG